VIHRQPQSAVTDRSTEVDQDDFEVIRPLNDVAKEEVELEPPEEEQFGARNPRKMLDPKLPSQREIEEALPYSPSLPQLVCPLCPW